jgi:hypothetical protein
MRVWHAGRLTIFEMLDRLEAEIISLLSPGRAQKSATRTKRINARRKKAKTRKTKLVEVDGEQRTAREEQTGPAEAARLLGKRQALGRSLLQLRKFSVSQKDESAS